MNGSSGKSLSHCLRDPVTGTSRAAGSVLASTASWNLRPRALPAIGGVHLASRSGNSAGLAAQRPLALRVVPFCIVTALALLLAQAEAPDPLLPDGGRVIWTNVVLLSLVAVTVVVFAWRAWVYVRESRRRADEAMEAVADLQRERQGTSAS